MDQHQMLRDILEFLQHLVADGRMQEKSERGSLTDAENLCLEDVLQNEEKPNIKDVLSIFKERFCKPGDSFKMMPFVFALGEFFVAVLGKCIEDTDIVKVESAVLQWLTKSIGYPEDARSYFCSDISSARWLSIACAAKFHKLCEKESSIPVIYCTDQKQTYLFHSLNMAGIRNYEVNHVSKDINGSMDVVDLRSRIENDISEGYSPFMVIANIGTSEQGSEVITTARQHNIWCHCDATYGGMFLIDPRFKKRKYNIYDADSVVIDPYKALSSCEGHPVLMVRHKKVLSEILQCSEGTEAAFESARHCRVLSIWFMLKLLGEQHVRNVLSEKMKLSQYLYEQLDRIPGVAVGTYPELPVVTFRVAGDTIKDGNRKTEAMLNHLMNDRRFSVHSMKVGQIAFVCVCVTNVVPSDTMDSFLDIIKQKLGARITKKIILKGTATSTELNKMTAWIQDMWKFADGICQKQTNGHNDIGKTNLVFEIDNQGADITTMLKSVGSKLTQRNHDCSLAYGQDHMIPYAAKFLASLVSKYTVPSVSEQGIISHLLKVLGLAKTGAGSLHSSRSVATLYALVAAKHHKLSHIPSFRSVIIYGTPSGLKIMENAKHLAGLRNVRLCHIPYTQQLGLDIPSLENMIVTDIQDGNIPFMVVGEVGSIVTGQTDDLTAISQVALEYKLWFHVDTGITGAFFFTGLHQSVAGIEMADSMTVVMHPFTPETLANAAILVKEGARLKDALSAHSLPPNLHEFALDTRKNSTEISYGPPVNSCGVEFLLNTMMVGTTAIKTWLINATEAVHEIVKKLVGLNLPLILVRSEFCSLLIGVHDCKTALDYINNNNNKSTSKTQEYTVSNQKLREIHKVIREKLPELNCDVVDVNKQLFLRVNTANTDMHVIRINRLVYVLQLMLTPA